MLVSTTIDYENTTQNGNVSIHILILTYRTDRKDCYCIVEILRTVDLFQIDFLTNGTEFFLETIVFPFLMKPIEVIFEEEQIQIIIQIIRSYYSFIFILLCQIYIRVRFWSWKWRVLGGIRWYENKEWIIKNKMILIYKFLMKLIATLRYFFRYEYH